MSGRHHFPLVDSLRAGAALAVLGTHVAVPAGLYTGETALGNYAARLDVGVAVFFLISGFLLYRPFARARIEGTPRMRTRAYAWRRFLRIAPAYWVALVIAAVVFSAPGVLTATGIPTYFGMAQAYDIETIGGGLAQAWTLTIELAFYAFLPLFARAMARRRGGTAATRLRGELAAVAGLIAVGVAYKLVVLAGQGPDVVTITPALIAMPAYLDQFGLGMGLAVLSVGLAGRSQLPRPLALVDRHPWVPWLVALVAFWTVSTRLGIDTRFFAPVDREQYLLRHLLYAVVALGLLLPAVIGAERRGLARRLLASRVLVYLGLVSYGIYLYNILVVGQLVEWGVDGLLPANPNLAYLTLLAPAVVATVLVASASWYLLERPALGLKRRVSVGDAAVSRGRAA